MIIYDIFFAVFALAYLPYLVIKGKAHRDFCQRLGILSDIFKEIAPLGPVWIHAVSVGEVLAAKNFIKGFAAKYPERRIVLSTTTTTGNAIARKVLDKNIVKFYFPLDFSFVTRRVVRLINPSAVAIMETEIWPNLILELSRRGIPLAIINGRLSERSFKGYRRVRFFFGKVLRKINLFCMQTTADAERIKALGGPAENVKVTGNMKFDVENPGDLAGRREAACEVAGVREGQLLIAGSTHSGEEEIILDVYGRLTKEFPDLRLLIAPRHIDRAGAVKKLVEKMGFKKVRVLDTLGELTRLYEHATVVFMGGSLVKRGGHNIVEPAAFARAIVFGPHMFNFRSMAKTFLEHDAALRVADKEELLNTLRGLFRDKEKRVSLGGNAKKLLEKAKGATERNIREVAGLIS